MRESQIDRKTRETEISVKLNIDGSSKYNINCEFKFFKHMLEQFAYHSGFDVDINAVSLDGDEHHLVEDVALALGCALSDALKDKTGINRYGQFILPMDDALVMCAVDLSGRPYSKVTSTITEEKISDFSTILIPHFFNSLAQNAGMCVHIKQLEGTDAHHTAEAMFKSFARALKQAVTAGNSEEIPSTKGIL